jgi:hypothetical protein
MTTENANGFKQLAGTLCHPCAGIIGNLSNFGTAIPNSRYPFITNLNHALYITLIPSTNHLILENAKYCVCVCRHP